MRLPFHAAQKSGVQLHAPLRPGWASACYFAREGAAFVRAVVIVNVVVVIVVDINAVVLCSVGDGGKDLVNKGQEAGDSGDVQRCDAAHAGIVRHACSV